jgi:fumarate hydratase class II
MACCLVLGNDVTIGVAGSRGNLELNVFKPLLAHCLLSSIRLLAGGCTSFEQRCARGIEPDRETIARHVERSLMLVTALAPRVGYDAAARIAGYAHTERVTLARAAEELGILSAEEVDELVRPEKMV